MVIAKVNYNRLSDVFYFLKRFAQVFRVVYLFGIEVVLTDYIIQFIS